MSLDPTWPAYPIMVFLSFLATAVPLTWIGRDNTGMIFLLLWLAVACINEFVNTIVWHGNALNSAPIWCDISTRINIAIGVSVPASALCMCRRLYRIASMKVFILTPRQRRRAMIEDLAICLGIPVLEIILQYVVSDHRFIIFEDIGCLASYFNSWETYVLMYSWPIILGVIGALYAGMTIYTISKKGKEMDDILRSANIKKSHYTRVIILACCEICFATPFSIAVMVLDLSLGPLSHYKNWNYVHSQYSEVIQIPAVLWRSMGPTWIVLDELYRWMFVFLGFTFFALFGLSMEAKRAYGRVFWPVAKVFGMKRREPSVHEEKTLEFQQHATASSASTSTQATDPSDLTFRRDSFSSDPSRDERQGKMEPTTVKGDLSTPGNGFGHNAVNWFHSSEYTLNGTSDFIPV